MSAIDQISSQRSGLMLVNGVAFAVWQATELTHLRELDSATLRILGASAVTLWICTTVGLLAPSFARSASTAKDELTRFNRLVALGWGYWVMMRFFLRYDSTGALAKLGSPVLSLKGSKDLQVDARDQSSGHTPGDRKQSGRNGRGDAWLNHLYQTAPTGALGEYADMEESFAPAALNPSSVTTHLAARSDSPRRGIRRCVIRRYTSLGSEPERRRDVAGGIGEELHMVRARKLDSAEIAIARSVYASVLPFDRIYITDLDLGGAVTLAGMDLRTGKFDYTINWVDGFGGITGFADRRATLVHELCHVWQGENGVWPTFYMGQSLWSQLSSGIRDIWRQRKWRGWGTHRSTAYPFPESAIGNDWSSFNVEQQASLVESWYMPESERVTRIGGNRIRVHDFGPGVYGGGRSEHDARFPYIRDVIRARNRSAGYRAPTLPQGGDPQVKAIQDKLVELGYLEARHADGLIGRTRSATLDAVEAFQRRNGLRPDRDLGGPNSLTRRKLALPVGQLVRA